MDRPQLMTYILEHLTWCDASYRIKEVAFRDTSLVAAGFNNVDSDPYPFSPSQFQAKQDIWSRVGLRKAERRPSVEIQPVADFFGLGSSATKLE